MLVSLWRFDETGGCAFDHAMLTHGRDCGYLFLALIDNHLHPNEVVPLMMESNGFEIHKLDVHLVHCQHLAKSQFNISLV